MPRQQTDYLIELINSLSKGEKRSFRLYANRNSNGEDTLYIKLFDILDKYKTYDERLILTRIPRLKKSQLSNVKANLYRQILTVLRNLYRQSSDDIAIRDNLDIAKVLYQKGFYHQSLELIEKAKKAAMQHQFHSLAFSIIEFERYIESQHVTGSMFGKAEEIKNLSDQILQKVSVNNELSNFSLLLYGFYLKYGYVKDKKDHRFVKEFFDSHNPNIELQSLDFYEKLMLFQSYVWYYNMIQDFANTYRYAQHWVDLFHTNESKMYEETPLYLKGLHNVLNALFMVQRYDRFLPVYKELLNIRYDDKIISNRNNESLWTLFSYLHGINKIYLTADYREGVKYIQPLEEILAENTFNWDLNRIIVFYYKIACIYFGDDKWEKAILYLNKIINNYYPDFRGDIQCFSRILNLISHYELGNDILVSYQVKSVYRFLAKLEDLGEVQKEIFSFLKRTPSIKESDLIKEFNALKRKLIILRDDPYERRPFLYLDIIAWLDAKIKGITMQQAIRENMK